jgi:phospholipase/carboxylesterase
VPIFMAHGTADPLIPLLLASLSRKHLEQQGYRVEWHQYLMPHSVCQEEIRDIGQWLQRVLA